MAERRILYLTALVAALVFFWAYRQWISWIVLLVCLMLPFFSLLLSLPAMLRMRLHIRCPDKLAMHDTQAASLLGECDLPHPVVRGRLLFQNLMTQESLELRSGEEIPAEHAAAWRIQGKNTRVYDYLGLFSHKLRRCEEALTYVLPPKLPMDQPPSLSQYLATAFKPKPGGGYAENHELRLYRPGDNLHQIHWKLTAKTGKLILREPLEPIRGRAVVSLELTGEASLIDAKLGRLLWVSQYLLEQQVPHEIRCLTGAGVKTYGISEKEHISAALLSILKQPKADPAAQLEAFSAAWRHHIGGDGL